MATARQASFQSFSKPWTGQAEAQLEAQAKQIDQKVNDFNRNFDINELTLS